MGFTIDFGASPQIPGPKSLDEFYEMISTPGPDEQSSQQPDVNPLIAYLSFAFNDTPPVSPIVDSLPGAALKFALSDGNSPQPSQLDTTSTTPQASTGAGAKWFVKGGTFKFQISNDFALHDAVVAVASSTDFISLSWDSTQPSIYSRPMHDTVPMALS